MQQQKQKTIKANLKTPGKSMRTAARYFRQI